MLPPIESLIGKARQEELLREAEQMRLARQVIEEMRKHSKDIFDKDKKDGKDGDSKAKPNPN